MSAAVLLLVLCMAPQRSPAAEAPLGSDPYWILLHEKAVLEDLNLDARRESEFREFMAGIDARYCPLRNQTAEQAAAGFAALMQEIGTRLPKLLTAEQNERIHQILMRRIGMDAILREEVAARLGFTSTQKTRISEILDDAREALVDLRKEAREGLAGEALLTRMKDATSAAEKKVHALLKPDQEQTLIDMIGPPFDLSQLGQMSFKAPDLVDTHEWINGSLAPADVRGKVVVLHFYACGCINCIHNFPWYRQWADEFRGQDVVLLGIHTPEVDHERQPANVRSSAEQEQLSFPILIDGKSENWNAWGNSMWPTVYVIDRQGYVRHFWQGELKWNGRDGEKFIRERIHALLEEPAPATPDSSPRAAAIPEKK